MDMDKMGRVAAEGLVSSSIIVALIGTLAEKGILSDRDTYELYEQALLNIETTQGQSESPEFSAVCQAARNIIENALVEMGDPKD